MTHSKPQVTKKGYKEMTLNNEAYEAQLRTIVDKIALLNKEKDNLTKVCTKQKNIPNLKYIFDTFTTYKVDTIEQLRETYNALLDTLILTKYNEYSIATNAVLYIDNSHKFGTTYQIALRDDTNRVHRIRIRRGIIPIKGIKLKPSSIELESICLCPKYKKEHIMYDGVIHVTQVPLIRYYGNSFMYDVPNLNSIL